MKSTLALTVLSLVAGFVAPVWSAELKPVVLVVKLPANAVLELLGQTTEGTGAERRFGTPPLEVGTRYPYSLKATWTANGKQESFEHRITVTGGQIHEVVFTSLESPASAASFGGGSSQEQQVLALVNQQRAAAGMRPLMWNETLANASRMHSANMARQNVMSHDLNGSFMARVQAAGGGVMPAGENIAQGQTSASEVVNSWMNSSGHRANILNSGFTSMGAGVSAGAGGMFWTQVFGR